MNLLFVCTGNTCRSPMAEFLCRAAAEQRGLQRCVQVRSCGVAATDGDRASAEAIAALHAMNIDLTGHRASRATREQIAWADRIDCMTAAHRAALLALDPTAADRIHVMSPPIPDPFGCGADVYRHTARCLQAQIDAILDDLSGTQTATDADFSKGGDGSCNLNNRF